MDAKTIFAWVILSCLLWSTAPSAEQAYRLGPGDTVRVTVFKQPDLNTVARVAENGTISFPLLGEIKLQGLTEREAEQQIATRLEQNQMVRSPQVSLLIDNYQSQRVSVLGQVAKPGLYPISRDTTLVDLIAQAGGLTENAADLAFVSNPARANAGRQVVDLRNLLNGPADTQMPAVAGGDRIFIPQVDRFYIYGQINHPGSYRLEHDMTVMQAVSVAGGLTSKATERGLTIRRKSGPDAAVVSIDASLTDRVLPSDVVHVEESLF